MPPGNAAAVPLRVDVLGEPASTCATDPEQAQAQANYYLSNAWTIGVLAGGDFGSPKSDFGSLPTAYSVLLSLRRYL